MTIIVDRISSFTAFQKEISGALLDLVPSSLIATATKEINQALSSPLVQKNLKEKKVEQLQYEIVEDEVIIRIEENTFRAKIQSDPFHRIYEFLTRINMTGKNPLRQDQDLVLSQFSEEDDDDSNLSSTSNIFTMIRNALSMDPAIGPNHVSATALGSFSGIFSIIFGMRLMNYANQMRQASVAIEDTDGIYRSKLLSVNAATLSTLGVSFFVEKMYQTFVSSEGGTYLGKLVVPLYIMVSFLSVIFGSYRLYKIHEFTNELNSYYQNQSLTPKNRLKATFAFLKDHLQPTALEKWNIERLAEKTTENSQERQAVVAKKIDQLIQRKKAVLERNTSAECVKQLEKFDFTRLYMEDTETAQKANELRQKIIDVNNKKTIYFTVKLVASFISLSAAIAFAATPIIAIPATLVIVSSLIHLLSNHQKVFDFMISHLLHIQGSIYNALFSENGAASI